MHLSEGKNDSCSIMFGNIFFVERQHLFCTGLQEFLWNVNPYFVLDYKLESCVGKLETGS